MQVKSIFSAHGKCFFALSMAVMFASAIFTVRGQNNPGFGKSESKGDYLVTRGERPPINYSEIKEDAYHEGVLIIKFNKDYERHLEANPFTINRDGVVSFQLEAVDQLNSNYGVRQAKQHFLSPALNNTFTDRHKAWGLHLWYMLMVDEETDIRQMRHEYSKLSEVEVAEPSFRKMLMSSVYNGPDNKAQAPADGGKSTDWTPNDPMFNTQWHYNNTGQHGGTAGADIDLIAAWNIEKGHTDVAVAIIDNGIQFDHPDLAANMWQNASGHYGYNFVNNNSTIVPGNHGTHVAGTVAALSNNGTGVAGVAGGSGTGNGVRLMSCQVFQEPGNYGGFHLAPIYAADNGAAISQNSWGYTASNYYEQNVLDAIDYFNINGGGDVMSNGITIFSAGNYNSNANYYPGYYSGTLAVAATNNQDIKADYSNYGIWIDISAPGGESYIVLERGVRSTITGSNYDYFEGTSMACPHVSGVAALLVSYAHRNGLTLNRDQVWGFLVDNVDDHYPVNNSIYAGKLGSGRLNANLALTALGATLNTITWQGTVNNLWSNPGNWDLNVVPDDTYNVIIPNTANKPYLTSSAGYTGYCKSLTILSGGQLYIGNGILNVSNDVTIEGALNYYSSTDLNPTIALGGNWTRTGTFTHHNNGRVIFNGAGHQYVNSNESFSTLEVNNGAALRINNSNRVVSCNVYDWKAGGIDVIAGTFTAGDLAQNGIYGGFWLGGPNATINLTNSTGSTWVDLRGQIYNYGGTLNLSGTIADWPYANGAHLEMTGGVIDFKTCGLTIYNSFSWTNNVSGGTIRISRNYNGNRADFTPTGGTFEFYGSTDYSISQSNGSTLHHVRINKGARDGGEDHIHGPVYDERSGELLSDGSRANTISLASNITITGNLDIDAGTFSIGQYTCDIDGNTNVTGTLAMTHASGVINAIGDVVWNSGSTANFSASTVFWVYGDWIFQSGSSANLASGVVAFAGSSDKYVTNNSSGSSFNNISSYKTTGYKVGISYFSGQALTINGNIYVHPNATFGIYSVYNIILKGDLNSHSDFHCNFGTVVLNGVNQSLRLNTGNYFNHLTFNQSGTVTINTSLSNILDVKRNVVIQSGMFDMQDRIMHVGGNWTNNAGTAAFTEGTGRVMFNGTGIQTCNSETFHILEVNKASGTMNFPGTTVCTSYDWTAGGITVNGGVFTANDLTDNGLFGSYTVNNGTINLHQDGVQYIDFAGDITIGNGGVLNVYGGLMMSYWPFFSDASLTMSGNAILDIKDQGILVSNNAHSFTTNITGGTIRTSGGFQGTRADFTPTAGTFEFYGSADFNISQSNSSTLHHVKINKGAKDGGEDTGTGPIYDLRSGELLSDGGRSNTITMSSDFTLTGNLNIDAGTLNASNLKLNVGRDWTNNVGASGFNAGNSTVEFFGPNQAKINTAETFYNMTVNKTYGGWDGLEIMSVPVTVLNNLDIVDGTLEVNSNSVLTIGNNVSIADAAGLNVGILDFDIEVYIGGNYTNNNLFYDTFQGYTPGGETITFNGAGDQVITTAAATEDFNNFVVNKTGGKLKPAGNLQILGSFDIYSGDFSSNTSGLTHYFHRNFTVHGPGNYYPGTNSTTVFKGTFDQTYERLGGSSSFRNFVIDKTAGKSSGLIEAKGGEPRVQKEETDNLRSQTVTLLTTIVVFDGSTTTIGEGTLNLNGNNFKSTGPMNINTGGKAVVPAGSNLYPVGGLYVNSGGILETIGTAGSNAKVRHDGGSATFPVVVGSGGTIKASHTIFEYMNANGLNIKPGAVVDATHCFHHCTFRLGAPAPSTLLAIDNSQTFTANHTVFPSNIWGGQYNVTKNVNQGHVTFYNATGSFAGENFDNDFSNRIDWFEPTLTANPLTQTVTPPASTTTFNITSNMTWTVTESTGWFSVAPMGGSNNGTITVTYDRNTSASSRSGNITISAPDVADVILSVVQEGVALSLNPLVRDVSAGAGTVGFSLTSNAAWTIAESIPWFSISPMNGTGNSMLAVSYDENTSLSPRSGQLTISSTGVPDIVATVNQAGVLIPVNQLVSGTVLPGDYECYDASQTITVQNYVVENNASVNLVAGQNIIMLPGTHAKNGSYFHAWISDVDHCGIIPTPTFLAVNEEIIATAIKEEAPPVTSQFFRVYPNPTSGLFTLELADADETASITVEIYSMLGEILLHSELLASGHYQFDLSGRQAGMYLIRVRKGNMVGFEKMLKH